MKTLYFICSFWFFMGSSFVKAEAVPAPIVEAQALNPSVGSEPPLSAQQPSGWMTFVPFLMMFGVMYFLVIRPQQKKAKEQQDMISALKQGDEVVTTSGILGTLEAISDKVVTLKVAQNVELKVLKNQISQVMKGSIKDLV